MTVAREGKTQMNGKKKNSQGFESPKILVKCDSIDENMVKRKV